MSPWKPARFPVRVELNRSALPAEVPYHFSLLPILNPDSFAAAEREIRAWPGYRPTELVALPGLARAAGLGAIWYKDEGSRFGLGSFKALGGAYAVYRLLADAVKSATGREPSSQELMAGAHKDIVGKLTVCTATDGNHGRSVAWGARLFGCRAVIYIHATVSEGRRAAIARYGAEVRRVAGNYDDSVRQAASDAAAHGWFVVSDTSYEGYREVPKTVMEGYGVMASELLGQLPAGRKPTHFFIQAGVGALPAAMVAALWQRLGIDRPYSVVVEPDRADCLYQSAVAGQPAKASGDLDTLMAGLAAGEVSLLAWEILARGANAFITVPDEAAVSAMKALAEGVGGDRPVVGGEAGVGGLAGALAAAADPAAAEKLGLGPHARVLVIGSEGDTDPELYERIVGRSAAAVRAA
ncbi:MAG: diaminopropionate ammonia-lyase [Pseudomonadota bacterium]